MRKYSLSISIVLICSLLTFFGFKEADNYFELSKNMEIYASLVKEINTYYVDEIDPDKFTRVGIDAMLKSLDPYTNYYSESEVEDYKFMTTGQYGGIGAQISTKDGKILITEPYENWPAHKADLRAGDVVVEVDGRSALGRNSDEISKLLKGQPGTTVKLLIQREGIEKPFEKLIVREEIKVKDVVFSGMLNDHIGYVKFIGFHQDASKELKDALQNLQSKPSLSGLVIDVRGNPGGLLDEAIKCVNLFVEKGLLVVSTKGKMSDWNKEYKTEEDPIDTKIPIVMITDKNSASAAEILSGSLQDLDRAVVVGENSFGKGLVQTSRPLPYNTQIKVTVSKYYIPSGRCIQELDYSHRDDQGKVMKYADSLRTAFKTRGGRTVYDGNGIKPDIKVEQKEFSDLVQSLASKRILFDYATLFRSKHETIATPEKFSLNDEDFNQFLNFLKNKDYEYSTETESTIIKLQEAAKTEHYLTAIQTDLDDMTKKLKADKKSDVIKYKKDIMDLLTTEISSRYYLQRGKVISSFKSDPDILEAMRVLEDKTIYEGILSAAK